MLWKTLPPAAAGLGLPAQGMIHYRVDRGDQGFMIGESTHDWDIVDGAYRITAKAKDAIRRNVDKQQEAAHAQYVEAAREMSEAEW